MRLGNSRDDWIGSTAPSKTSSRLCYSPCPRRSGAWSRLQRQRGPCPCEQRRAKRREARRAQPKSQGRQRWRHRQSSPPPEPLLADRPLLRRRSWRRERESSKSVLLQLQVNERGRERLIACLLACLLDFVKLRKQTKEKVDKFHLNLEGKKNSSSLSLSLLHPPDCEPESALLSPPFSSSEALSGPTLRRLSSSGDTVSKPDLLWKGFGCRRCCFTVVLLGNNN